MQTSPPPRDVVLGQLDRMLASDTFAGAERSRVLLRFLVEHVVEQRSDRLKEYTLGSEALGRGDAFDPRTDPIVRAEASRLRSRLERYYAAHGAADTVLITLPKGSYVPQIHTRAAPDPAVGGAVAASGPAPDRRWKLIWFVLGGLTVAAAIVLFAWSGGRQAPRAETEASGTDRRGTDLVEFTVDLSAEDRSLGADWGNELVLSPDGTRIVFVARSPDSVLRLMTMLVGQPRSVVELRGTEAARAPFFSPDSRWVGFWADARLKTVSVDGGAPVDLIEARDFFGASWGDGEIIATIDGDLWRVAEASGQASRVASGLRNDRDQPVVAKWPDLLPGGTHVLFTAEGPNGPDAATIEVLSLADGTRKLLIAGGTFARYLPGYLLFVNQGTLYAVAFDLDQLAVRGPRIPVLDERVDYSPVFGFAQLGLARDGRLIYRRSPLLVPAWLDRSGKTDPLPLKPGWYVFPRLSPDGQRLAINVTDGGMLRTELYDLRRTQATRLPFPPGSASAVWHSDGFLVLGGRGLSWMNADAPSQAEPFTQSPSVWIPYAFSADRSRLTYAEAAPDLNIWTIPVSRSGGRLMAGEPELFQQTQYFEGYASFSPDDRWVAFAWGPQGKWDVYVRPYPPTGTDGADAIKVSEAGGRIPRWLPNGREIVYRTDDHRLMVVEYQVKDGVFVPGRPREWTSVRLADTGVLANFDVDPAGDRILGLVPAPGAQEERLRSQVTVMPRFADDVRRRLSAGPR